MHRKVIKSFDKFNGIRTVLFIKLVPEQTNF